MKNSDIFTINNWIKIHMPFLCFNYEDLDLNGHLPNPSKPSESSAYFSLPKKYQLNYLLTMKISSYPSELDNQKQLYNIRTSSNQPNNIMTQFLQKQLNLLDNMELDEFDRFHESDFMLTLKDSNRLIVEKILNKIMLFFICPTYFIEKGDLFESCPFDDVKIIKMIYY